jgi:hypothetical protein
MLLAAWNVHAADRVLLVAGPGGEPQYTQQFTSALQRIRTALVDRHHYDATNIHVIAEDAQLNPAGPPTLDALRTELEQTVSVASPDDTFLLIMIGHGQSDYVEPKLNLTGPDLDAFTLDALLSPIPMNDIRLILSFPCAGHFSEFLTGPRYAIIAATDGPRQIYHCAMHEFLPKAFEDEWSDQDGDGALTFYELFEYLSQSVDDFYTSQEFLQTENVSLEDTGDGRVTTRAEGMDAGDGEVSRARRICPAPAYENESPKEAAQ